MGRIKLRRLLIGGLVLILFLSLVASAFGVSVLVRGYLWNRSKGEIIAVSNGVERFLARRAEAVDNGQTQNNPRWANRTRNRGMRRFNRGPGQILLLDKGQIVRGDDDEERDWSALVPQLKPGLHVTEFEGERWIVYFRPVESDIADHYIIIRPWSPSVRLVRMLVAYQVMASIIVLALALVAVSFFASRLARPLEELREKSKKVGKDSVADLTPSAVVEISALQTSFLDMSQRVEEAMANQRRFVADASHELKTPLTAIAGMLELMRDRPEMDADDRVQALNVAKKEADRMQSLISDLLLLSRAQAQRSGEKSETVLRVLAEEQIQLLKVLFPEQEFQVSGDLDMTHNLNAQGFSRVARNLLENACRYAGGQPIEVVFQETQTEKIFSVKDRGPGIPQEKLDQLFERFYRTDSGRARTDGGHGLGLAIVKALVEEAQGSISCKSKEGEGSEFRVSFNKP